MLRVLRTSRIKPFFNLPQSLLSTNKLTPDTDLNEYVKSIDTKLSPEKRAHVERLKRQIKGGPNSPRSIYRDIPTAEEVDKYFSENPPFIPDNAEALIDYALSLVPERAGKRGSRRKRRFELRSLAKQKQVREMKQCRREAGLKKQARSKKQRQLVRLYKDMTEAVAAGADPRAAVIIDLSGKALGSSRQSMCTK